MDNARIKYKVIILNCFYGSCNKDTCIVESNKNLDIDAFYVLNGHSSFDNIIYCYFNYFQINTSNSDNYSKRGIEYFEIADQMARYAKNRFSSFNR